MEYNVYCDESCHLEHDTSPVMVLGGVYLPEEKIEEVNERIKEIKNKYDYSEHIELKWTKISPACLNVYMELIDYFFDDDDLQFRCLIAKKENLNHAAFKQTHDSWYYKMYFGMLKAIFYPRNSYNIYVDIKDTNSNDKCKFLNEVLCNNAYDFDRKIIKKIQPVRSYEGQLVQIADILVGAVSFVNRYNTLNKPSVAKTEIAKRIMERSGYNLRSKTLLKEHKFNIFVWEGKQSEQNQL